MGEDLSLDEGSHTTRKHAETDMDGFHAHGMVLMRLPQVETVAEELQGHTGVRGGILEREMTKVSVDDCPVRFHVRRIQAVPASSVAR